MKIAIQTLNLHTNYGGILQAYALQTVLQRMGHEAVVIYKNKKFRLKLLKAPVVLSKRFIKRYILGDKNSVVFLEKKLSHEYLIMSQNTQRFIDTYINKLTYKKYTYLPKNCVDAIVVGSDQVWRPMYFGRRIIGDAYLRFAQDWDIKRIVYAASFGTDQWEYTPEQTSLCRDLLKKFDVISVREDTAVHLCRDYFGAEAKHLLDPTMLLEREDYIKLVNASDVQKSTGNLLVYVLDETEDKQRLIDQIATQEQLTPFKTNSKVEDPTAPLLERIQPPLENWLRGFMDAEFVVTDSFHACVFSILFNKPFVVYGNETRGRARFDSLLKMFGLEAQYVSSSDKLNLAKSSDIDWPHVNNLLAKYRDLSNEFLKVSLG